MLTKENKKAFSTFCWMYFILALSTQVGGIIVVNVVRFFFPFLLNLPNFTLILSFAPLYFIGIPIFLICLHYFSKPKAAPTEKHSLSFIQIVRTFILILGTMYAFNLISLFIVRILSMLKKSTITNPLETVISESNPFMFFIVACIIAPVAEELLFRFIPYSRLVPIIGERGYLIISSVFFGIFHGNFSQIFYAFAAGWLLGLVYLKTGNIKYSILFHIAANTVGSVVFPSLIKWNIEIGGIIAGLTVISFMIGAGIIWARRGVQGRVPYRENEKAMLKSALLSSGFFAFLILSSLIMILSIFA